MTDVVDRCPEAYHFQTPPYEVWPCHLALNHGGSCDFVGEGEE